VDLYEQGAIPDLMLGAEGGTATSDGLPAGEYATILDGPWMFPIFESQYPDFDLQTAPMPAGDGGSISVVGGESIVLTQSSQNKAAAAEFMRFLLSEEVQLELAAVGQMPVLSSLAEELPDVQPYYAAFVEQVENARPRPPTPAWPRVEEVLSREVQLALRGEKSVEQALGEAASEIDGLLAQYAS
jgi:multiple sugar transport system substrate-binding protein